MRLFRHRVIGNVVLPLHYRKGLVVGLAELLDVGLDLLRNYIVILHVIE